MGEWVADSPGQIYRGEDGRFARVWNDGDVMVGKIVRSPLGSLVARFPTGASARRWCMIQLQKTDEEYKATQDEINRILWQKKRAPSRLQLLMTT